MRRDLEAGRLEGSAGEAEVRLILDDGREHDAPGKLQFADVSVDPGTGSIGLRAIFPNPRGVLLPGLFVRARINEGTTPAAILVPQRAITRDATGKAVAMVVTPDKKVERRMLTTGRAVGDSWLVTEGLSAGEQVIVDGLQKVRPGAPVSPVAAGKTRAAR
jgi:membrane fusion protein (multidrug efflux system)